MKKRTPKTNSSKAATRPRVRENGLKDIKSRTPLCAENVIGALLLLFVALALALSACSGSSDDLTGIVWQWTAMQETAPASQSVVPDPENYTITFNEIVRQDSFTAADLDNAGTAAITIGAITSTAPGVFTVEVTPTSTGTRRP